MDVKEKLVEVERAAEWYEKLAGDTPMPMAKRRFELAGEALREKANGLTVQEWISVKDRLPEDMWERVLVSTDCDVPLGNQKIDTDRFKNGEWLRHGKHVTHWMPLPEMPKG